MSYADPRRLKERNRTQKAVTSPRTGETYLIRKLEVRDYLLSGVLPLAEWVRPGEEQDMDHLRDRLQQELATNPSLVASMNDLALSLGCVQPRVVLKAPDQCADDEICPSDLGPDRDWLVAEILHFSGWLDEAAVATFRGPVVAPVRQSGPEVQ